MKMQIMRITGDNEEGKAELDNFIFPESKYPVIATTSKLMTTGVDAQTCKLIVLDQRIQSMTEFKQFYGQAATADYYHQEPCVGGTKVVFKSDKDKTVFAKEVVPTLDGLWFEPFRPVFEFIKSKCVGGVAP